MKKYIFLKGQDCKMQILIANSDDLKLAELICEATGIDDGSFNHLWSIIQGRYDRQSEDLSATEANSIAPPCTCDEKEGIYSIMYDVTEVNRLVGLFTLLKAWFAFYGCNDFDIKQLYY